MTKVKIKTVTEWGYWFSLENQDYQLTTPTDYNIGDTVDVVYNPTSNTYLEYELEDKVYNLDNHFKKRVVNDEVFIDAIVDFNDKFYSKLYRTLNKFGTVNIYTPTKIGKKFGYIKFSTEEFERLAKLPGVYLINAHIKINKIAKQGSSLVHSPLFSNLNLNFNSKIEVKQIEVTGDPTISEEELRGKEAIDKFFNNYKTYLIDKPDSYQLANSIEMIKYKSGFRTKEMLDYLETRALEFKNSLTTLENLLNKVKLWA